MHFCLLIKEAHIYQIYMPAISTRFMVIKKLKDLKNVAAIEKKNADKDKIIEELRQKNDEKDRRIQELDEKLRSLGQSL